MTNPPDAPPDDGGAPPVSETTGTHDRDATPPRQKNIEPKGPALVEKTVKFRFTRVNQHDAIDPTTIHLHWVQMVQEALKTEIQVCTNNGGIMPKVDTMRWTAVQHGQQYKVHQQQPKSAGYNRDHSPRQSTTRSPAAFIIHRIRTTSTITSIRNLPSVQKLFRENGVYFTEHRWSEDISDLSQQGFMLGIDPQFYSPAQAHIRISAALNNALQGANASAKIPKFAVAFCTPQVTFNSTSFKTKAYAIETEKSKAIEMQRLLKEACKKTNDFVPFHLRAKHPEAFSRFIQQHTMILSKNHTIVLNYIGNQAILYLEERIRAIPGVIDIVSCQSVESDGKFRVQVKKEDFYRVRSAISKNLPQWFEEHVPDDAKREMRKFPYAPEVAPLMSDGYSSGSDGYMTASINTALSYTSMVSQLTPESLPEGHRRKSSTQGKPNQPTLAWKTPPPAMIDAPNTDTGLISELESSRSEVEALKAEMANMEVEKLSQIKEIEEKAEKQRQESEARAQEERAKLESQVEAQRVEFQQKLEAQRQDLEEQNLARQRAMESRFQDHINQAIQAHLSASQTPPPPPLHTIPAEVATRMENQDARIQHLTDLIQQLVTRSPAESQHPPSARISTGKRHASHVLVDLTMDHQDLESASPAQSIRYDTSAKKRDTKDTPRQNLAGNISIKLERADSPAPSELSMSMMEPPASQVADGVLWNAIHPPSDVYSPPAPPRVSRTGIGTSPMSNLALHPDFQEPGVRYSCEENSVSTEDFKTDHSTTNTFDESKFSEAHMTDICAQHAGLQGFHFQKGEAESTQEVEPTTAKGPTEDVLGVSQAKPVDESNPSQDHEG
jgi:hypothetical protein